MKKLLLACALATTLFSCDKDKDKAGTFKGAQVQVHDGKAWTWIKMDKEGKPVQLGLTISNAALNSVPLESDGGHDHENNLILPLHEKAIASTPFKFLFLNWNAEGHPPMEVYGLAHFDIHYYMVPAAEVTQYTDEEKLDQNPPPGYVPATFFPGPYVPQMGKHFLDSQSPELDPDNPQPFTQTFIYGTYGGKVTFYEPMITLDFLKTANSFERTIPQPQKFEKAGYYPTRMKVVRTAHGTDVILEGLTYRDAS
ncbi:MAG TPA: DUF5602 domain-containing protein [Chitinophagaceae bacterium]|jgi:hypothetical protein|nr:DUF5602 domain-containing protein [Chitinophagaceae bacterium]